MSEAAGHSVLVVPVPALEACIRGRWQHYDATWVSSDPAFTHAHVTALAPFLSRPSVADLARVAAVAATTPAFGFTLERLGRFADGTLHLLPDPAAPFATLTARLWAEFPACPPYAGEFADVVPHLTVDRVGPGVTPESVRRELADLLPLTTRAERLELHWYAAGDCHVMESWPLRG
ncbi:2'-5' RNA ligase family protein [Nocardioides sp. SYSU DS0651]|uniref:2'-5' RNA ligase family protein n=1 Tax=Nocardioides sp. SYSU DS0651 TaxID=3415955 RepID=UPI003F4BFF61